MSSKGSHRERINFDMRIFRGPNHCPLLQWTPLIFEASLALGDPIRIFTFAQLCPADELLLQVTQGQCTHNNMRKPQTPFKVNSIDELCAYIDVSFCLHLIFAF